MGGHNIRLEILCQIHDPFGILDQSGIQLRISKALAEVPADCRHLQPVGLDDVQQHFAFCSVKILKISLAGLSHVDLKPRNPQRSRLLHCLPERKAE